MQSVYVFPFCAIFYIKFYNLTTILFQALYFEDHDTAARMMAVSNPRVIKELSYDIAGFDEERWNKFKLDVMRQAVWAKFTQNKQLQMMLLRTGNSFLAESSPTDYFWGTALGPWDPRSRVPNYFLGENHMGQILMDVRERLPRKLI